MKQIGIKYPILKQILWGRKADFAVFKSKLSVKCFM